MVDLDNVLYPALFERLDTAFPEFGWVRTKSGWKATNTEYCKSLVGAGAHRVVCHRPYGFYAFGGAAQSWIEWQANSPNPRGHEFKQAVEELGKRAGIAICFDSSPEQQEEAARTLRKRTLFEDFWGLVTDGLSATDAAKRRDYLLSRDLSAVPGDIDCGYVGDTSEVGARLQELGYGLGELAGLGLFYTTEKGEFFPSAKWNNRIVGKLIGHRGQLEGFWLRTTDSEEKTKYVYSTGLDWKQLGVSGTCRLDSSITIVEGVFEPDIFRSAGLPLWAIGGSGDKLQSDIWRLLVLRGVRQVTLFLDEDPPGIRGRAAALASYASVPGSERPQLYIVDNTTGFKDPDEVRRNKGVDAVKELIDSAEHYLRWSLKRDLDGIRGGGDWTDKALDAAFASLVRKGAASPPLETQRYILPELEELFPEVDPQVFQQKIKAEKERLAQAEKEQEFKKVSVMLSSIAQNEGIDHAIKVGKEAFNSLAKPSGQKHYLAPASIAERLSAHKSELASYWGKSAYIGIQQKTIPEIDYAMMGMRGVIVVPGPPNSGKSAFVHQLGMDAVKNNDDVCYVYWALEMDSADHINRMWSRFADMDYRTFRTGSSHNVSAQKAFTNEEITKINAAEIEMIMYGTRILILDKYNCPDQSVEAVNTIIANFMNDCGCTRVVIIVDYLQKLKVPGEIAKELGSELKHDDWRIEQITKLMRTKDDPVFVISQQTKHDVQGSFGALAKVKGSSGTAYEADAVWFIRNITDKELCALRYKYDIDAESRKLPANADAAEEKLAKPKQELADAGIAYCMVSISKGRDGMERAEIPVTFYFRKSKFTQGWEMPMSWGMKSNAA